MRDTVAALLILLVSCFGLAQNPPPAGYQPKPALPAPFPNTQSQVPPAIQGSQPAVSASPAAQVNPSATPGGSSEVTTVVAAGDKNLYATMETSLGKFKVELFATITPRTVRNFVELANGQKDFTDVKTGRPERRPFYDGLLIYKVVKGFSIQTGCPYGTGKGGPGYIFNDELTPSLRFNKAGMVAMANTGPNTNGSQFFITLSEQPNLDDKYTIFGQVISGMEVVRKIANVKVGPTDRPLKRVFLKKISISE